jgi:hypothetical protein
VPITTKVVLFESRSLRGAFDKTPCDKVCRQFDAGAWFYPSTPVSFTNNIHRHNTTAILLKVALNTIILFQKIIDIATFNEHAFVLFFYGNVLE